MKLKLLGMFIVSLLFTGCVTVIDPIKTNPVGKIYDGSIPLDNMIIPLPEGKWTIIGRGLSYNEHFINIALLNPKNQNIIYITRNSIFNSRRGYHSNKHLNRKDIHYSFAKNNHSGQSIDGWLINHFRLSSDPNNRKASQDALDYLIKNGYSLPGNYIQVYHFFTGDNKRPYRFLEYTHFYNPETDGFAPPHYADWGSSDWHPLKINSDPKKISYIEKIKKDGEVMHQNLKNIFDE